MCLVRRYFKRAQKKLEDAATTEVAVYEEVGGLIAEPLGLTDISLDANTCYSLKQDPLYAEIEDAMAMKLNDAYGFSCSQANKHKILTDPPRPLADQEKFSCHGNHADSSTIIPPEQPLTDQKMQSHIGNTVLISSFP